MSRTADSADVFTAIADPPRRAILGLLRLPTMCNRPVEKPTHASS